MKKIFLTLVLTLCFAVPAFAETKIAVVDLEEVIYNSIAIKEANKVLETKKAKYQKEITAKEKELNAKKQDIESKSKILSEDKLRESIESFQKEVLAFQSSVQEKEQELQKAILEARKSITNEIKIIIDTMLTEDKYNYDLIIQSQALVHSSKDLDISSEVLKRLNKKVKKIDLNF